MTRSQVDLGFDLGTTVTKVTAVDEAGTRRADHAVATTWRSLGEGRAERDPAGVVADVEHLLAQVAAALGPAVTVRSIGFTSMAEAGVLVDRDGVDRSPVIAWHDPRGADQAAALPPDLMEAFPARTGLPVSHVASIFKLAWLREQGLDLRGLQWLSVPEFVILRLGGRRLSELSLLGRTGLLDVHTDLPWRPAFDYLGVDTDLLPEIVGAGESAGTVRANHPVAAVRGAVLTVAGHDHAVAAAATGCGAPGSALDSFGTAEAYVAAAARVPGPDIVRHLSVHGVSVYPHVVRGVTGVIAGTRTGLVLKRVQRVLGSENDPVRTQLDRAALAIAEGSATDVRVTGYAMSDREVTISLLSDGHTPAHVWRAALDGGTAYAESLLRRLRGAGVAVDRLVVAGGWTRMAAVLAARRRLAPVVEVARLDQPGTYGAARFAQWAAGPGADAVDDRRPPAEWFTTDPEHRPPDSSTHPAPHSATTHSATTHSATTHSATSHPTAQEATP
jgi:sugar (pentulose or hexulose) kinase